VITASEAHEAIAMLLNFTSEVCTTTRSGIIETAIHKGQYRSWIKPRKERKTIMMKDL
jgi:hypothetical protein